MDDSSQPNDTRSHDSENWPPESTISILVATDNHLGCFEKDPIRGNDSLTTFEEILKIAEDEKVDMVLLGGDLFHDNKPSRHTLFQTMKILRQYCFGNRPSLLNLQSDPTINFQNMFGTANYLDPNINVSLPVFSIHGNHDEPCGKGSLCALDLLSVAGLVNYFGRSREVDNITLHPIMLQKGATRLALYGLGNVRDERLHETFVKGGVEVMRPKKGADAWFNLLAVHQNRVAHTSTSYIPEHFLESCFDLVVWGHEHECLIEPELNSNQGFYVTQPGSSVATSLIEGEAAKKHVAVVKINRTSFHLHKIPLKTVRPFVFRDFYLDDTTTNLSDLTAILLEEVKTMITEAESDFREQHPDEDIVPPKPLIRLRVELAPAIETISHHRFTQFLVDKVANPRDAIQFRRPKQAQAPRRSRLTQMAANTFSQVQSSAGSSRRIEDLILEVMQDYTPGIFPEKQMVQALQRSVEKDERDVLKDFMDKYEGIALNYLGKDATPVSMDELRSKARQQTQLRRLDFNAEPSNHTITQPSPAITNSKRNAPISETQRILSRQLPDDSVLSDDEYIKPPAPKVARQTRSRAKPKQAPRSSPEFDNSQQASSNFNFSNSDRGSQPKRSFAPPSPKASTRKPKPSTANPFSLAARRSASQNTSSFFNPRRATQTIDQDSDDEIGLSQACTPLTECVTIADEDTIP